MAAIRATGASLLNTIDINANNISVFDNKQSKYININDVYIHNSQIIEASPNENNKFEYPIEDVNDNNISGLHSMINYINSHTGKKPNYYFYEDNSIINIKKKINNSSKKYSYDESNVYNKITNTISHIMRNQIVEDNSNIIIKKSKITSKKNYIYDDNTILNKINKITNSNIYKHYSVSNLQQNILSNKTIINNNITRKTIPNYIQEDNYFYFSKNYDTVISQIINSIDELYRQLNIG
jgi:hypothetical protein